MTQALDMETLASVIHMDTVCALRVHPEDVSDIMRRLTESDVAISAEPKGPPSKGVAFTVTGVPVAPWSSVPRGAVEVLRHSGETVTYPMGAGKPGDMRIVDSTEPDWSITSPTYQTRKFRVVANDYFTAEQALEFADELRAAVAADASKEPQ